MRLFRVAVIAVFAVLLVATACSAQSRMDAFAQCLASKNVKMYGAYWCPHCKDQKDEFKGAFKYVPYVECAIPGRPTQEQTDACKNAEIKRYPTWIFPDGERVEAVLPLAQIAQKAGCPAPPPSQ